MDVTSMTSGSWPVAGTTGRCIKARSFRIVRRGRNSTSSNSLFNENNCRLCCQGKVLCPRTLAASLHNSISPRKSGKYRSMFLCQAQVGEEVVPLEESSAFGSQNTGSSKPWVWNPSYKRRLNKHGVGGEFLYHDTALSALQGGLCGLCDGNESAVSRRAFLKSLIQGRMENINYDRSSPGGGDNNGNGGGKGYGGSDGEGGFGEPWDWSGFFIAGTRGWVFIAAAVALVTSIFAQIFRSAGSPTSPSSRSNGTSTSGSIGGSESDGVKLHLQKGGSLSHASNRNFRGPSRPPKKEPSSLLASFTLAEQSGLWGRDEESNELEYRGFFHRLMYPPPQAVARAYHRCAVRMVGPKPGDWVETVEAEEEVCYESLNRTLETARELDDVFTAVEQTTETEQANYSEELYGLRDELKHVHRLLKKSESKRQEALQRLKQNNHDFEERELALRTKIKNQEEINQKIRKRLREIDTEKQALAKTLEEAKGSLLGLNPNIDQVGGQINELTEEVQAFKTNLRLMENQLVLTSRERDAVVRRMEVLLNDVNDMESVLEVVQKSQELIVGCENEAFSDKIEKVESCVETLQRFDLKAHPGRHLSPIREVNQRVVILVNKLLSEMKRSFVQSSKCVSRIEGIQGELGETLQAEKDLKDQLVTLRDQQERIQKEKDTSESIMESLKNDLVSVHEQLDGSTVQEDKLREAIEKLTSDKDELSAMARKFQREIEDVEGLLDSMEKTRNLILQSIPSEMGVEHIAMLENCLMGLQQQQSALEDSSRPVTGNLANRLVKTIEEHLLQTKQCLLKSEDAKKTLKRVEADLSGALAQEDSLNMTIEGLRAQLNDLSTSKCNLSNDINLLKNERDEKVRSLEQLKMELEELDSAHDVQSKEIESLQEEIQAKKALLQESKKKETDLTDTLKDIIEERDDLLSRLDGNEADLDRWKASLEEIVGERLKLQEERDNLVAEKSKLETQLSGLTHRINDFESENSRLNTVAQTLKSNLDNERQTREQIEQEHDMHLEERADLREKMGVEIQGLKDRLDDARRDCANLRETCQTLEEAKVKLEQELENEHEKLNAQLEKLKEQHQTASGPSTPPEETTAAAIPESPFAQPDLPERPRSEMLLPPSGSESQSQAPPPSGPPEEPEAVAEILPQETSIVQNWLQNVEDDTWASMPSERNVETAPVEQNADDIIESLMPAAGGMREQTIVRRSSWPQDMTNALSDNLFGAAQELVDLTAATLALAAEKNGLEQELTDVRQAITESKAQLEEREAEVSELTEHFLQVYQIASDLATDNEEQSNELRELRLMYERQKQDIEIRDERLTYLEKEYALLNKAPPRIPISAGSHYAESVNSYTTPVPSQRQSREFGTELHSRVSSFSGMGYDSADMVGRSPRLDAPGTPSMISAMPDAVGPRAHSSATNISAPQTRDGEETFEYDSISDISSLSGASDDHRVYDNVHQ